jgi:ABC-type molybdenum transport system ATPase subunit/photorepair protein PhrA
MISLIIGHKGSGKTKKLIDSINARVEESHGNVVCIEKGQKLTYDLTYRVRLVDSDRFGIQGFDELFGFVSGICAGNYDVTDIFVDGTLKIGGQDKAELLKFLERLSALAELAKAKIMLTISCDEEELPEAIHQFDIIK